MGGETTEAWRAVLDDLVDRGLHRPAFLIVDGAPGLEKAIAAGCMLLQRLDNLLVGKSALAHVRLP